MEKKLYPLRFIPVASKRPWGGHDLMKKLGKEFVELDEDDNEIPVSPDELIGESWEIADMGIEDSVVSEGWLAGNGGDQRAIRALLYSRGLQRIHAL